MKTNADAGMALRNAVLTLLRPLVRLLLRHGVPFAAFADMAKQVYVDVAMRDFALEGRRPTVSRASILTGLTRKEVQRLLAAPQDAHDAPAARHNRAVRVLTAWVRDADFLDVDKAPRALPLDGEHGFAALARRHSGDMPARAVLDELLHMGAVRRREDGLIEPVARGYVPRGSPVEKLRMLGTDVADLIDTIDHNIDCAPDDPRFQRKVMYDGIPVDVLPAFRRWSATFSQALLEKLDRWLAERDAAGSPSGPGVPRVRVGVGIYYFEEAPGSALAARETS
jgi:Family of unknown function (DUF6502)